MTMSHRKSVMWMSTDGWCYNTRCTRESCHKNQLPAFRNTQAYVNKNKHKNENLEHRILAAVKTTT